MEQFTQPLADGWATFYSFIPQLIGAILILIVGYVVAKVLQAITARILKSIGFENWMERGGVKQFFDRAQTKETPTSILALVAFWFVFILFLTMAVNALGIPQVSGFLNELIAYIPSIFAAIIILFLAGVLANFVSGIVRGATSSDLLASVAQYAILIFAAFAALTELGIAVHLTANTFLILLAGVALAGGLAFGLGGQGVAREMIENGYKRRNELRKSTPATGASASPAAKRETKPSGEDNTN